MSTSRDLAATAARLPHDQPFTRRTALGLGVVDKRLGALVAAGLLRRPLRSVYVAAHLVDDLALRAEVLSLVVPPDAFVCDRTAAWLHGAPAALAPGDHLEVPQVSCFRPSAGGRLRNGLTDSGERAIRPGDLQQVGPVVATTPLRTALDLGRLQPTRDLRLAGMDAMAALGVFTTAELEHQVERFARRRGVVLLRLLAPLVDGGAQSQAESSLRLRWYDAGLPRPRTQVPVRLEDGSMRYLDLGLEEWAFAAEYDGEAWHSSDAQVAHDTERRHELRTEHGWQIEVFGRTDVYGVHADADLVLRRAFAAACASYDSRVRYL
jgi:hypothetical protein